MFFRSAVLLGLLLAAAIPSTARAAQSLDACAGYVDTLPAVISTQGVWCLRKDLSSSQTSGAAITVQNNNVTIDCNDFKLGGLLAGPNTHATGIAATARSNITVRNCNIRGFYQGIALSNHSEGTSEGHLIENNSLNSNTYVGVWVQGDDSIIRNNRIFDTGGSQYAQYEAFGIFAANNVDVLNNTISRVLPNTNSGGNGSGTGIYSGWGDGVSISGNRIRGIWGLGSSGSAAAIRVQSDRVTLRDNDLTAVSVYGLYANVGIACVLTPDSVAIGNVINGFHTPIDECTDVDNVKQLP